MANNKFQGQIKGPFNAGEELMDLINADAAIEVSYVTHLGVQTETPYYIQINGESVEIGKTGIYEIGNTEITSIIFEQDVDDNTIIDYVIQ